MEKKVKNKAQNWYGKLKAKFNLKNEVEPEKDKRLNDTSPTNQGFGSERVSPIPHTNADKFTPENLLIFEKKDSFKGYESFREEYEIRRMTTGNSYRNNNFEHSQSFYNDTMKSRETLFKRVGDKLKEDDE